MHRRIHPRPPRPLIAGLVLLVMVVVAAACSGGDDPEVGTSGASVTAAPSDPSTSSTSSGSDETGSDTDTGTGSTGTSVPAEAAGRPSPGCEPTSRTPSTSPVGSMTDTAGRPRTFLVAAPPDIDRAEPAPLVVGLHGALGNAVGFATSTEMVEKGLARGFVVVLPDAIAGSWDYGPEGPDDPFLLDVVDEVAATRCIDLDRVHLAGMSLGAWKSAVTACNNPGRFASLVLVTVEVRPEGCEALPVLAVHGTSDHIAPYGEGGDGVKIIGALGGLSGTRQNVAAWAEGAGCDAAWDEHRIEPDVVRWVYQGCPDGYGVELYTIEKGDHAWPGSRTDPAPTTDAVHATDLAFDWFEDHRRPAGGN